jgi:hypothetical protein
MNRRIMPVAAIFLATALAPAALAGDAPQTYDAALALATETGKPVVLDFFTEW